MPGLVAIVSSLAAAGLAHASEAELSGRISFDYVPRWLDDTEMGDQDIHVGLLLDLDVPEDRITGAFYWRAIKDVDGISGSAGSRFRSVYDAYGDGWFNQLFYAYGEYRSDGPLSRVKVGRQFLYEGQPFHFDGLKLQTREWFKGLRALTFVGAPVHFFEDASSDWLVGVGAEMRPWEGGRLKALFAHVEDGVRFAGLPETSQADDLYIFSVGSRLGDWGSALARYTGVDAETRDVLLRANASFRRIDTDVHVSFYAQPETLSEFTTDISIYNLVQGPSYPYRKTDLSISKGFKADNGWRTTVDGRLAARRLSEAGDEGEYNRDYDLLWLGVGLEAPGRRKFSASIGYAWWWSTLAADVDVSAFDAEMRWRPVENLRLGLGTSYSLYRYNAFSLAEETDVRETFLKALWKPDENTSLRFRWAFEKYNGDLIHKVELGCAVQF